MGIEPGPLVTLSFLEEDGLTPRRPPVEGVARFYSKPRPESPGNPDPIYGSLDWLTDVMVAHNQSSVSAMKPTQTDDCYTSCASKRVLVQWEHNGKIEKEVDCLTLATLPPGQSIPTSGSHRISVAKIKVLPGTTKMNPKHALWDEWKNSAVALNNLKLAQSK